VSLQDPASQLAQLVALEHLLAVTLPERAKEAPLALKALYDADVIAEELMLAW
jgi:translation initiation factor 5